MSPLQQAFNERAQRMVRAWKRRGAIELKHAHRLLDAEAIAAALINCAYDRCKELGLQPFPQRRGSYVFPHFPLLLPYLREMVVQRLVDGLLAAAAIDPMQLSGTASEIAPDRWKCWTIDWECSAAEMNDHIVAAGIMVSAEAKDGTAESGAALVKQAEEPPAPRITPLPPGRYGPFYDRYVADNLSDLPNRDLAVQALQDAFPGYGINRDTARKAYVARTGRGRGKPKMANKNGNKICVANMPKLTS